MIAALAIALAAPLQLPTEGPWGPSELVLHGTPERYSQVSDCIACHADAAHSWSGSAHAHASLDNPWYLASLTVLRADVGPTASRHCAGCHDPALLVTGAIDAAVLSPTQPLADLGVPCLGCHGVVSSTSMGNASSAVDVRDLPDPRDNVAAHKARMASPQLTDGTACQGCHRGVLTPDMGAPHVMTGFDDWGAWQSSAWAGTDAARLDPAPQRATCTDCHSHAMEGGRTTLQPDHLLHDAVTLWLPQAWVDGAPVVLDPSFAPPAGAEVVVDAVVRNTGTGHRFPGGLGDTQDVWLALTIDADGTQATSAGPHIRALPIDLDAKPVRDHLPHKVAAGAVDHTIPPGEAQLLQVRFTAPGGPVALSATLRHRPHRPELADAACAITGPGTLDGCAPLPETVITEAAPVDAQAWYALALARSRARTEDLPAALDALDLALDAGLDPDSAAVLAARILGRQGRIDDALAALEGLPDHAAVHATAGKAYAAVWRWDQAAEALTRAVALAPLHTDSWRLLARARLAAGDDPGALDAARQGLLLVPRDATLLRVQALAAIALKHPEADEATAAWEAHQPPDGLSRWRMACERTDPECSERGPIPLVHIPDFDPVPSRKTP